MSSESQMKGGKNENDMRKILHFPIFRIQIERRRDLLACTSSGRGMWEKKGRSNVRVSPGAPETQSPRELKGLCQVEAACASTWHRVSLRKRAYPIRPSCCVEQD